MPDKVILSFEGEDEKGKAMTALLSVVKSMEETPTGVDLYAEHSEQMLPNILRSLSARGIYPQNVSISSPTLDDVFFHVTRSREEGGIQ